MAWYTSKVFLSVLGTGTIVTGLTWNGGQYIDEAKQLYTDTKAKIFDYEANENTLLGKIAAVKKNADEAIQKANGLISSKNTAIADLDSKNGELTNANGSLSKDKEALEAAKKSLEADKEALTGKNGELNESILKLNTDLETQIKNLEATKSELEKSKEALNGKTGEYNALKAELDGKIADLNTAKTNIENLSAQVSKLTNEKDALAAQKAELEKQNGQLAKDNAKMKDDIAWGVNKAKEVDGKVKGVEDELGKANKSAEELGAKTQEFKSETNDAKPLTKEEIDKVGTDLTPVVDEAAVPAGQ